MVPSSRRPDMDSAPFTLFSDVDDAPLGRFRAIAGSSGTSYDYNKLVHAYDLAEGTSSRASSCDRTVRSVWVTEHNLRANLVMLDSDDSAGSNMSTKANEVQKTSNIDHIDLSGESIAHGDINYTNLQANKVVLHRHNDSIDTGALFRPIVETRYVRDGHNGPAPFTKPHIITETCEAPFTGPHTAIEITIGPDRNSWIHIPQKLTAAETRVAMTAIFDLWLGLHHYQVSHTSEDGAHEVPQSMSYHIGPSDAPYPMTEHVELAPFKGPHTYIRNTGCRLAGWILHVPRFLTKEQIQIATTNLRHAANDPDGWGCRHDPCAKLAVTRSVEEDAELTDLLNQQDRTMTFLMDVIGLDFAVQDDKNTDLVPLWTEHAVVHQVPATPARVTLPLTPPPTISDKSSPEHERYEQRPAVSEPFPAGFQRPIVAIEMDEIEHSTLLSRSPPSSSGSEFSANIDVVLDRENVSSTRSSRRNVVSSLPVVEIGTSTSVSYIDGKTTSPDVSSRDDTRPSLPSTPSPRPRKPLVILPQNTIFGSVTQRGTELVFNDVLDDLTSEDDVDSLLSQSSDQATPISLRSLESRVEHLTNQVSKLIHEKMPNPASVSKATQTNASCLCTCTQRCTGARDTPAPDISLPGWLRPHIRLGLPGTVVTCCVFSWFCDMQDYLIYPTDVANFLNAHLARRNGIAFLSGTTLLMCLPTLAWCCKDRRGAMGLYDWLVFLSWVYLGAVHAMDKELWEDILNPRLLY
jgi:hypothetical protein